MAVVLVTILFILSVWIGVIIYALYKCGFFSCCYSNTKRATVSTFNCCKITFVLVVTLPVVTYLFLRIIDLTFGYNSIFYNHRNNVIYKTH